jgi:hypothetical protein
MMGGMALLHCSTGGELDQLPMKFADKGMLVTAHESWERHGRAGHYWPRMATDEHR